MAIGGYPQASVAFDTVPGLLNGQLEPSRSMQMPTLIGIALLELLVVLSVAVYVDCRRPKPPFWAGDTVLYVAVGPALVGLLALGGGLVVDAAQNWSAKGLAPSHWLYVAASLAVTALLIVLLRPRRRLRRYASMQPTPTAREIEPASLPRLGTDREPEPRFPKAA